MKLTYNELFLKILAIINYEDRENFVKGIEERNHLEALANCIEKLPRSAREEIKANLNDPEVIQKYISKDIYMNELTVVSTKALAAYLQYVTPFLSDNKKKQIAAIFPN